MQGILIIESDAMHLRNAYKILFSFNDNIWRCLIKCIS